MVTGFDAFLLWEKTSRDTIDFKKIYVDMTGDLVAGLMLSQIVYWHIPNSDSHSKLRVFRNGYYWIAKDRRGWWDEIRVTDKQARRAIEILVNLGLVIKENHRFDGKHTSHFRINQARFLELWNETLPASEMAQRPLLKRPKGTFA